MYERRCGSKNRICPLFAGMPYTLKVMVGPLSTFFISWIPSLKGRTDVIPRGSHPPACERLQFGVIRPGAVVQPAVLGFFQLAAGDAYDPPGIMVMDNIGHAGFPDIHQDREDAVRMPVDRDFVGPDRLFLHRHEIVVDENPCEALIDKIIVRGQFRNRGRAFFDNLPCFPAISQFPRIPG